MNISLTVCVLTKEISWCGTFQGHFESIQSSVCSCALTTCCSKWGRSKLKHEESLGSNLIICLYFLFQIRLAKGFKCAPNWRVLLYQFWKATLDGDAKILIIFIKMATTQLIIQLGIMEHTFWSITSCGRHACQIVGFRKVQMGITPHMLHGGTKRRARFS